MSKRENKKDIVFAIFLIFVGTIFLLNTTGVVGWGIWEYILRFWPIFLILAGVKLIFGGTLLSEIIIAIFALLLFAFVGIFSYLSHTAKTIPFLPERISTYIQEGSYYSGSVVEETLSIEAQEYNDLQERKLNIDVGASKFSLTDDTDLEDFLVLDSKYTEGHIEPFLESSSTNDTLDINFETTSGRTFAFWRTTASPQFDLTLGQTPLSTDINVTLGAGKGEIELTSLEIGEMNTRVGAGKLDITFGKDALPETLNVDVGAGAMTITLPENIGYKLDYQLGVGEISTNNEAIASFAGEGVEESGEWAEQIVQITANVGVGSLEINNE